MKKSLTFVFLLFFVFISLDASFSGDRAYAKKGNGTLIVITKDTDGQMLGNVSFTLNAKNMKTDKKGKKLIKVPADKSYTIKFGDVDGYTIKSPQNGTRTVKIAAGKREQIEGVYEKVTIERGALLSSFTHGFGYFYYASPTLVDNNIYIGTSVKMYGNPITDNYFFKLDSALAKVWEYSLGSKEVRGSAALDSGGNVYFVVEEGRQLGDTSNSKLYLYSLDSKGNIRWTHLILSSNVQQIGAASPAIASDDTIYVGVDKLYALTTDGTEKWTNSATSGIYNAPIIDKNGNIYFIGNAAAVSVDSSGNTRWTYAGSGDESLASPAFSADGSKIYAAINDTIYCLNAADGAKVWQFTPTGMAGHFRATPAVDNEDNVYIGTKSNNDSVFYAVKSDGSGLLWQNAIGRDLYSSPALGDNGILYVGSEGAKLHALDMKTGVEVWSYQYPNYADSTWSSVALSNDGTLYIGNMAACNEGCTQTEGGYVFAIATDSTGLLQNAGSARFHQGNESTGRK
ncbi:MAG: PQQ-like beta-propeller repeat protein [Nitrospinae bacterium]|nr:PQQ-like beta-propeller repeat protein [Nitrospinota bacterium]